MSELPDYVLKNRAHWDTHADEWIAGGERNWTAERAKLIEKNELAKSRVESMITRLKALEHD